MILLQAKNPGIRCATHLLLETRAEIQREGILAVGKDVPAGAVQNVALDPCDADALPAELGAVPCLAVSPPGEDGVEACEDKQRVGG